MILCPQIPRSIGAGALCVVLVEHYKVQSS